jgi:hypothetical protein
MFISRYFLRRQAVLLVVFFSFWAHFCCAALRKNRAFRYYENAFTFSYRFNRLRGLKAYFAVKIDADFRFENGIPDCFVLRHV